MTQWPWSASNTNQAWQITSAPDNSVGGPIYSNLMCMTSSMALASWGSNTPGQDLLQYWAWWACGPSAQPMSQEDWLIQPASGAPGYYNLICKINGMALDNASSTTAGTSVTQCTQMNNNPNQQWMPVPMYSWAAITFITGGDNLRGNINNFFCCGDSYVDITLTINGNQQKVFDVSQDQSWDNGSTHTVYLPLNTPVSSVQSGDVQVGLDQEWVVGNLSGDNWNLQALSVTLYSIDPDPTSANPYGANAYANRKGRCLEASKLVYSGSGGSSWQRFGAINYGVYNIDFPFTNFGR